MIKTLTFNLAAPSSITGIRWSACARVPADVVDANSTFWITVVVTIHAFVNVGTFQTITSKTRIAIAAELNLDFSVKDKGVLL